MGGDDEAGDELAHVGGNGVCECQLTERHDLIAIGNLACLRCVRAGGAVDNGDQFIDRGLEDVDLEHETVKLGFGQGEGAFVIDGVLRGDDHERTLEDMGLAIHGDTPLGHRFQEG